MPRVWAAAIAPFLTLLIAPVLRASHPPAGATTLIVALGSFRTWNDVVAVIVGVLLIAAFGEGLRQARLGHFSLNPQYRHASRPGAKLWIRQQGWQSFLQT